MLKKIKYKLWKHLTKELVSDSFVKKVVINSVYANVSHRQRLEPTIADAATSPKAEVTKETTKILGGGIKNPSPPKIVVIQGLAYSGSSTLVGMLQEFNNTRVLGFADLAWTKSGSKAVQTECRFFSESGFIQMVRSFKRQSPEVISSLIRTFISNINVAYENKRISPSEKLPDLYNDTFRDITEDLLLNILDLDDYTRRFMRKRPFPFRVEEKDEFMYSSCSFTKGRGKGRYVFYQFADLTEEEFHHHISVYLEKFFSIISEKEYIVFDQLLPFRALEFVNQYLRVPVKQIVVYRDPRDQYLSTDRKTTACSWFPRDVKKFRDLIMARLRGCPTDDPARLVISDNPNRLILRFEDIVLKYEESKKKVMDFLGLKPENHVAPKSMFDPALSVANIGAFKQYHRPEYMQKIEETFNEYCFYPEREKLSDEAILLLLSSGNWDDELETIKNNTI